MDSATFSTHCPAPRYSPLRTPGAPSYGPVVARIGELLGTPLMPWQRHVADIALEIEPGGAFRFDRVLISVPRQSGKTTLLRPVMVHRALLVPDAGVWMSAQTRNDVRDTFMATVRRIERSPLARAATIRRSNGSEGIEFPNGGQIRIFAPAEDALHGKTCDLTFLDEIWALTAAQGAALMQAIIPTQVTRPLAQTWMVSTAGTSRSTFMRPIVNACRDAGGSAGRTAYFEWSMPDDADPLDLETLCAHHPAYGHTIRSARALAHDPAVMSAAEYARAYGNLWVSADSYYIAPPIWERGRTHQTIGADSPVAFALEVYPDHSGAVIAAAGYLPDGRAAVELVEFRGHMNWATARLIELTRRHRPVAVVIDPYGPARSIHARLAEQHHTAVPLSEPFTAADLLQADAEFTSGLIEGTLLHRSSERLDSALSAATTKIVREQTCIARTGDPEQGFPAALIAAMLAAYGLAHPVAQVPRPVVQAAA